MIPNAIDQNDIAILWETVALLHGNGRAILVALYAAKIWSLFLCYTKVGPEKFIDSSIFGRTFESIVTDLYSIYGHFSIWNIGIFYKIFSKFSYHSNTINYLRTSVVYDAYQGVHQMVPSATL